MIVPIDSNFQPIVFLLLHVREVQLSIISLASLYLPFQVVIFVTMQGSLCPMLDTAYCILDVDLLISKKVACLECKAAIKTQHLLPHMHYAIRIL